jgi:hypothetical protein
MAFDVTGKLIAVNPIVQRTESFRVREFVIETSEDVNGRIITNYIKFQATQDRCDYLDKFKLGDTVKVHFNLRGNKWDKNGVPTYFTNLDAWRVEYAGMQNDSMPTPANSYTPPPATDQGGVVDDLPF